ncbi:MAG: hypothetical protein MI748_01940, partial [Opitutales bacterium]|nr:hypothetical protein [Opitutales bacterium]
MQHRIIVESLFAKNAGHLRPAFPLLNIKGKRDILLERDIIHKLIDLDRGLREIRDLLSIRGQVDEMEPGNVTGFILTIHEQ